MTDNELQAIKALVEKATPAPWLVNWNWEHDRTIHGDPSMQGDPIFVAWGETPIISREDFTSAADQAQIDAAFIAAARSDVPALVAEVERLRAQLAAVPVEAIKIVLMGSGDPLEVGGAIQEVEEWLDAQEAQP